jgi:hypothetical protein
MTVAPTMAARAMEGFRKILQPGAEVASQMSVGSRLRDFGSVPASFKVGGAIALGSFGAGAAKKIWDVASYGKQRQREDDYRRAVEQEQKTRILQIQQKRLEEAMLRSAARLAAANPHLYNEIMAGRRLPLGAVVLGGKPRVDLMEQLALDMTQGAYAQEPSADTQLAELLGG